MFATRNLFANVPERLIDEEITILAEFPGARIERIVSTGQASQPGFWDHQAAVELGGFGHRAARRACF